MSITSFLTQHTFILLSANVVYVQLLKYLTNLKLNCLAQRYLALGHVF